MPPRDDMHGLLHDVFGISSVDDMPTELPSQEPIQEEPNPEAERFFRCDQLTLFFNVTLVKSSEGNTLPILAIVGAINDLMRYLRKCFLCSIELPKLGDAINEQRVALHSSLEKCLVQLANKFMIAVDDENGDEEGDLIMAASLASSQALAFMIRHGSGIVSVGMKQEDLERLSLPLISTGNENEDPSAAAYTVIVDLKTGASTGVSASDRAKTILALSSPDSKPQDFRRPGHVFPLKYKNGGVLRRAGHTEASVDLISLAGLRPISVFSAILNAEDGSMARLPALRKIDKENSIPIISILDLIRILPVLSASIRFSFSVFIDHQMEDGNPLYFGKGSEALEYFSSINHTPSVATNPSDFLLDLVNGISSDDVEENRAAVKEELAASYRSNIAEKLKRELKGIKFKGERALGSFSSSQDFGGRSLSSRLSSPSLKSVQC
ncbi:uncharacterized protein LOC131247045 [Magnolia sinica]|uniref:uncharacterized protein LOC131247045 n=1 Tax=Magnolia sinica TaxID=86752 RepID=UPI00265AD385|nr:uncharacterized protein LOC131247045 [Magnolia sinica]